MASGSTPDGAASSLPQPYGLSPLIRFTLISLYGALVLPLPWLAPAELRIVLLLALPLGLLPLLALLSERVLLTESELQVGYPAWCNRWLRRGWSLPWTAIEGLTPVSTSQGGRVYYLRRRPGAGDPKPQAYLLPQRLDRFEEFLGQLQQRTGIDTSQVVRLTPLWTYQLLAALSLLLLLGEAVALLKGWTVPG
ncbi:MAG: hypothetical protein VKK62_01095 [Synechococcaceae cyanobacterium]|nr:hypothetical protein [Synechococcaceae cyanobacterium]